MNFELVPREYLTTKDVPKNIGDFCFDEHRELCRKIYEQLILPSVINSNLCKRHRWVNVDVSELIEHDVSFSNGFEAIAQTCTKCGHIKHIVLNGINCDYYNGFTYAYAFKRVYINYQKLYHRCLVSFPRDLKALDWNSKGEIISITIRMCLFCEACKTLFSYPCNYDNYVYKIDIHDVEEEEQKQVEEEIKSLVYQLLNSQTTPIEGILDGFGRSVIKNDNGEENENKSNSIINRYELLFTMFNKALIGKKLLNETKIIVPSEKSTWKHPTINAEVKDIVKE